MKKIALLICVLSFLFPSGAHAAGALYRTGPGNLAALAVKDRSTAFHGAITQRTLTTTLMNVMRNFGCRPAGSEIYAGAETLPSPPPPTPTVLEKIWESIADSDRTWGVWGEYGRNWSTQAAGRGSAGYEFNPENYTFGADTALHGLTFGVAFNGFSGTQTFDTGETAYNRLDGWLAGVYSLIAPPGCGDFLFLSLSSWGGQADSDSRVGENGLSGKKTSDFTVDVFGAGVEVYSIPIPLMTSDWIFGFSPHIGLRYEGVHVSGSSEYSTAGLPRRLGSAHWNNWELPVSLRTVILCESLPFGGSIDISYVRTLADKGPEQNLFDTANGWQKSRSPNGGRDALRLSASLDGGLPLPLLDWAGGFFFYDATYTLEIRDGYHDNGFRLQAGFYF